MHALYFKIFYCINNSFYIITVAYVFFFIFFLGKPSEMKQLISSHLNLRLDSDTRHLLTAHKPLNAFYVSELKWHPPLNRKSVATYRNWSLNFENVTTDLIITHFTNSHTVFYGGPDIALLQETATMMDFGNFSI